MPDRSTRGIQYGNQRRAAELQKLPEHLHQAGAVRQGMQEHLTGAELSRQAQEHSSGVAMRQGHERPPTHAEIAALAYQLWEDRGSPNGSPDDDWLHAEEKLRHKHGS